MASEAFVGVGGGRSWFACVPVPTISEGRIRPQTATMAEIAIDKIAMRQ